MPGPGYGTLYDHRTAEFLTARGYIQSMQPRDVVGGRPRHFHCPRNQVHGVRRQVDHWRTLDADVSNDVEGIRLYDVDDRDRSEEHTSELQSLRHLVCRLLLEKKKKIRK